LPRPGIANTSPPEAGHLKVAAFNRPDDGIVQHVRKGPPQYGNSSGTRDIAQHTFGLVQIVH
jgi:hypothetical protein